MAPSPYLSFVFTALLRHQFCHRPHINNAPIPTDMPSPPPLCPHPHISLSILLNTSWSPHHYNAPIPTALPRSPLLCSHSLISLPTFTAQCLRNHKINGHISISSYYISIAQYTRLILLDCRGKPSHTITPHHSVPNNRKKRRPWISYLVYLGNH